MKFVTALISDTPCRLAKHGEAPSRWVSDLCAKAGVPPLQNSSKILGVAFNNKELIRKAYRDPGAPTFFL